MNKKRLGALRWPVRLLLAGLLVELLSLFGLHHPFGFMLFASVGCTLIGAGLITYLLLASRGRLQQGE